MVAPYQSSLAFDEPPENETPAQTWDRLLRASMEVRRRAELNSSLTFPEVYNEEASNPDDRPTQTGFHSLGYQGMNSFVNKLSTALFSSSSGFFRLSPTQKGWEQLQEAFPDKSKGELEAFLAQMERDAVKAWSRLGDRDKLTEALAHIAITGQTCIWFDKNLKQMRVIPLTNYALRRSTDGNIQTLVIAETLAVLDLAKPLQEAVYRARGDTISPQSGVTLYHRWNRLSKAKYAYEASVEDAEVEVSLTKEVSLEKLPVHCPYWKRGDQASYGIAMVDGIVADLLRYNDLAGMLYEGVDALTDWRTLVNPGGQTDVEDFKNTRRGEAVAGRKEDISTSETGNPAVLQFAVQEMELLERRINAAFLRELNLFRSGDRITAEEVRTLKNALDGQYAAMYSALAHRLQLPLAKWIVELSGVPLDDSIEVDILTGDAALTRTLEVGNLVQSFQALASLAATPPELQQRINWQAAAALIGTGFSVELDSILKDEAEFQQEQQAQQERMMAMQVAAQQAAQPPQGNQ